MLLHVDRGGSYSDVLLGKQNQGKLDLYDEGTHDQVHETCKLQVSSLVSKF